MAYDPRGERDHGGQGRGGGGRDGGGGGGYEGMTFRGRGKRPVTDYGSTIVHWMRNRQPRFKGGYQGEMERPSPSYIVDILPPLARLSNPADSIPTKHLHASLNKNRHPVNFVRWTPEGRRLLTGSASGEFTLWNGTGFNFETIMQAHDASIRALTYSHNDEWLVSADHEGIIKYWQTNFNNVKVIQGHNDAIRDIAFSPNDSKFVTASDDSTLKIFDFAGGSEEKVLTGHGWECKSVDWHPTKGLLVSGSKDHLVKLWDPRTGRCLTTLHGHKNTITKTLFEKVRGNCLATSAREQSARVFDLRMMRDICILKGHEKDNITALVFHPIHPNLLSTAGDGPIYHYLLDEPNTPPGVATTIAPYDSPDPTTTPAQVIYPAHKIQHAHQYAVWSLDWHPLGHILASGSNDRSTAFWTRARPGDVDVNDDKWHIGEAAAEAKGTWDRRGARRHRQEEEEQEMEDEVDGLVDQKMPSKAPAFPGMPGLQLPQFGKDNTGAQPIFPGMGSAPPPPPMFGNGVPPPLPGLDPSHPPDFAKLAEMLGKAGLPPPPPIGAGQIPQIPGMLPPGLLPPPGFPAGFPPPPPGLGMGAPPFQIPGMAGGGSASENKEEPPSSGGGSIRRRGPLPSQEESLQMEQRKGKYTRAR